MPLSVDPDRQLLELFGRIPLFACLDDAGLKELLHFARDFDVTSGTCFFRQGDAPEGLYVVWRGDVEVSIRGSGSGRKVVLARLSNGSIFGEMSLIDDEARSATALVHERCKLFEISRRDLEDLLFVDRDLAYELLWNFVRTLSRRLRGMNDKMTFLATTNKF